MNQDTATDLETLGRAAAQQIAGEDAVEQVEVVAGTDYTDRPVYYFSFLIDQGRARERAGLVFTRLIQKLRDDLVARGDEHLPVVRILDRTDWPRRGRA